MLPTVHSVMYIRNMLVCLLTCSEHLDRFHLPMRSPTHCDVRLHFAGACFHTPLILACRCFRSNMCCPSSFFTVACGEMASGHLLIGSTVFFLYFGEWQVRKQQWHCSVDCSEWPPFHLLPYSHLSNRPALTHKTLSHTPPLWYFFYFFFFWYNSMF